MGNEVYRRYAAAPVCSPTRASILTGKYPARLGITDYLPGDSTGPTQRKLLNPAIQQELPLSEVTVAERLNASGYVSAFIGKWHLGRAPFYPENQGFDRNVDATHIGMVNDFFYPAWADSPLGPLSALGGVPLEGKPGEYLPDRLAEEATKFIEIHKDRAFFLYLSHYAVHIPMQAKQDLVHCPGSSCC